MGDRYKKSDENKTSFFVDANNLYGWALTENLNYVEIIFDRNVNLKEILNTFDDSDNGYFVEVDLKYPDNKKKQNEQFSICS